MGKKCLNLLKAKHKLILVVFGEKKDMKHSFIDCDCERQKHSNGLGILEFLIPFFSLESIFAAIETEI